MSFPIATRALLESTFRDIDAELADRIMCVIECDDRDALLQWSKAAQRRDRECYTPADLMDFQAYALNAMLNCHGVMPINESDEAHKLADYDYLDAGDLYAPTLVRDNSRGTNGTWLITSVGDVREASCPPQCATLIQRFSLALDDGKYRGHTPDISDALALDISEATTFVERPEWGDRHRALYVSGIEHAILTYCEGDLCLHIYPTHKAFDDAVATCGAF